jgi:hypothetical protein
MWSDFYQNGGWGMYPTTIFGFFLVASALLLLLRPERRHVPLVAALGVVTLSSGVLGTSVGFINSLRYIQEVAPDQQVRLAALGCAESLNNLVLALLIVVVTGLLAAVAALRAVRAGKSAAG